MAERLAALVRDLQTSGTEDLLLVGHATTVALLVGAALGSPIEHARGRHPPGVVAGLVLVRRWFRAGVAGRPGDRLKRRLPPQ